MLEQLLELMPWHSKRWLEDSGSRVVGVLVAKSFRTENLYLKPDCSMDESQHDANRQLFALTIIETDSALVPFCPRQRIKVDMLAKDVDDAIRRRRPSSPQPIPNDTARSQPEPPKVRIRLPLQRWKCLMRRNSAPGPEPELPSR